jgi:high-affinity iron transporter
MRIEENRSMRKLSDPSEISTGMRGQTRWMTLLALVALAAGVALWESLATAGNLNPLAPGIKSVAAVIDIGVLVFREGLECVLVLAALTAGMKRAESSPKHSIVIGVAAGSVATLITWAIAVRVMNNLGDSVSALALQAATGLVAVAVLLVVMNWFFHKVYWTGWISFHTERRRELASRAEKREASNLRLFLGMVLLGFTSVYREGFEVVLFLQSYRLRLGNIPVYWGAGAGLILTAGVALLTFVLHRKLPYRRMLVFTGVLLGIVLMIMVGEQAQEMQLAGWIPTTPIPALAHSFPGWMSLWFSFFPTVETLLSQAVAALLVLGSYFIAGQTRGQPGVAQETHGLSALPAPVARDGNLVN